MFGMEIMQNFTNGTSDSYVGVGYEMRPLAKGSPDHRPPNMINLTPEEYERSLLKVSAVVPDNDIPLQNRHVDITKLPFCLRVRSFE